MSTIEGFSTILQSTIEGFYCIFKKWRFEIFGMSNMSRLKQSLVQPIGPYDLGWFASLLYKNSFFDTDSFSAAGSKICEVISINQNS